MGWLSLLIFDCAFRQFMGNTLMTIDAGLTFFKSCIMSLGGSLLLYREIHVFETVTVSAFSRVGFFHNTPNVLGQLVLPPYN